MVSLFTYKMRIKLKCIIYQDVKFLFFVYFSFMEVEDENLVKYITLTHLQKF